MDFLRSTAKVDLPTAAFEMLVFRRLRAGEFLKCLPEPCQPTVGRRTVGTGLGYMTAAFGHEHEKYVCYLRHPYFAAS